MITATTGENTLFAPRFLPQRAVKGSVNKASGVYYAVLGDVLRSMSDFSHKVIF